MRSVHGLLPLAVLLAACGAGHKTHPATHHDPRPPAAEGTRPSTPRVPAARVPAARVPAARVQLRALVTDETQNELLVLGLPSERVMSRISLPADPENVAVAGGVVVVVSSKSGKVTVLDRETLRPIRTFGGFGSPHIPAVAPDGRHVYVTDDARGTVTVIRLPDLSVTSVTSVGEGAHHLTFSPDRRRLWIALGESAARITTLDATNADDPPVTGSFSPGFLVHQVQFAPRGNRVWITSADGQDVGVFDAVDRRLLFRVPVGPPPQHLVFAGRYAYLTSGYGATLEKVDAASGRVIARTTTPYGSFELDAGHGYVVVSSLLRGTVADYSYDLKSVSVRTVAPAARDVAILAP